MKANNDRLITGAEEAAQEASKALKKQSEFAILVSCVGRKLVLKQMVEEEVECVSKTAGWTCHDGLHFYGELAPFNRDSHCELQQPDDDHLPHSVNSTHAYP